jgi:hypothetical protein
MDPGTQGDAVSASELFELLMHTPYPCTRAEYAELAFKYATPADRLPRVHLDAVEFARVSAGGAA